MSKRKIRYLFILIKNAFVYFRRNGLKKTIALTLKTLGIIKDKSNITINFENLQFTSIKSLIKFLEKNYLNCNLNKIKMSSSETDFVLLISHELDLTGAPIALQYFAETLITQNKCPLIVSPHDGALRDVLKDKKIPVVVIPEIYSSNLILKMKPFFSSVIVNTTVGAPIVSKLNGLNIPVLWWIHEAKCSYHEYQISILPEEIKENIFVYCVGNYAVSVLKQYRPSYNVNELLYFIPDFANNEKSNESFDIQNHESKMIFACVGSVMNRKGQDILCKAIEKLTTEDFEKCIFYFIGLKQDLDVYSKIEKLLKKYPNNVKYIESLLPEQIQSFYKKMDCLICSSRDDPMPIVITESFVLSKPVICSENTGSASLIKIMNSGYVYTKDSYSVLADNIHNVICNKDKFNLLSLNARKTYETYFSKEVFSKNVEKIFLNFSNLTL